MSATVLPKKVSIECSGCGFVRTWPREVQNFKDTADLIAFVVVSWGWVSKDGDFCPDCAEAAR